MRGNCIVVIDPVALRELLGGLDVVDIRVAATHQWWGQFEILVHRADWPERLEGAMIPRADVVVEGPPPKVSFS